MQAINKHTRLPIVGLLEMVLNTYPIEDLEPKAWGGVSFNYRLESSGPDWDSAEPVVRGGERVFIDEDGNECVESDIEFVAEGA